jgi:xanthine dehydrogenase YagS FAD-binding subunit
MLSVVHPFDYHAPVNAPDALRLLTNTGAAPLGGGTDLLVALKEGVSRPDSLVDLRRIPDWRGVTLLDDGGLRIGAGTRLTALAEHPEIASRYRVLAEACASVGTAALRTMGTIGGNLCQRPRCWYFRRSIPCLKNGGSDCPAVVGENQYHAIVDGGPCYIVHPSDPAVALTALDAEVELSRSGGGGDEVRRLPIGAFYVLPQERLDQETVLQPGEVVSAIVLPSTAVGGAQSYRKIMQRGSWDFALVSLAACRRASGEMRFVLGGVAPRPWRLAPEIEAEAARAPDEATLATLAQRALSGARPLAHNGYKLTIATALLRRALIELVLGHERAGETNVSGA